MFVWEIWIIVEVTL